MRALCLETKEDWDELAPFVAHAYRATEHESTGCTPNLLVFGEEVRTPADLIHGTKPGCLDFPCANRFVEEVRTSFRKAGEFAREKLVGAAKLQKRSYDIGTKLRDYPIGSEVYRFYPPRKQNKLCGVWDGPFEVLKHVSGTTLLLKSPSGKELLWHADLLKPIQGPSSPTLVKLRGIPEAQSHEKTRERIKETLTANQTGLRRSARSAQPPKRLGYGD